MSDQRKTLYFIREGDGPWRAVSKQSWVNAERRADFHNTMGQPTEPATGGFSGRGIQGSLVRIGSFEASQYDSDPELRDAVIAAIAAAPV